MNRAAATLVELLVVVAIVTVLLALTLPAVQKVRSAAARIDCANRLKQIALATLAHHDVSGAFPSALRTKPGGDVPYHHLSWLARILPQLDREPLWRQIESDFRTMPYPFERVGGHRAMAMPVSAFQCPADPDMARTYNAPRGFEMAMTSYLGNHGTAGGAGDGIIDFNSAIRLTEIRDGASQTLLVGERPPSPEFLYGWWYVAAGQDRRGTLDFVLGPRETNRVRDRWYADCGPGPFAYRMPVPDSYCSTFQFLSFHSEGSQFAFCDGSVRFLTWSADAVLPALATRAGGEVATIPE